MKIRKGTSRKEYTSQFTGLRPFKVVEEDMEALLRQTITIAGFIRYYPINDQADGYFDELLPELVRLYENREEPTGTGNMEPSQALLYTFLKHLQTISSTFNQRWEKFTGWYLDEVLRVSPLPPLPNRVWITCQKNTLHPVHIPEGTGFLLQTENKQQDRFLTLEELEVNNIELQKVLAYHVERNRKHLPAGYLNYVTAIRKKELSGNIPVNKDLFGKGSSAGHIHPAGIQIAHPSLLLREGKRHLTITLTSSDDSWEKELERAIAVIRKNLPGWSREKITFGLFDRLFRLAISSNEGWSTIQEYMVDRKEEGIQIRFTCMEDFPASTPCTDEVHELESPYPVLRILLNTDNWLYAYSWLRHFHLSSIRIRTHVEEIRNIQLYNDLGEVDTAKPFKLFGINTEKECWFVIGNYEMSLKQLKSASLHIQWDQLPDHPEGLAGYYQGYEKEIDNHSFRLRAYYLNDYQWHPTTDGKQFSLFCSGRSAPGGTSLPGAPLAKEIRINSISLKNMPAGQTPEEQYTYSIRSRTGFIRFRLETPDIGFGEKYYRILFTNRMMAHSLRKKRLPELNTPVVPVVEQLTLNYTSEDSIDLNNPVTKQAGQVYQYYPLGHYPLIGTNLATPSFCYRMETDASLLFLLSGVKAGDILTLYLVFTPSVHANTDQPQPLIVWYWGNGYQWHELPKEAIEKDTTSNLLNSGYLKIRFPNAIARHIYDEDNNLWLRAGIVTNAAGISALEHVYIHVAELHQQLPGQIGSGFQAQSSQAKWIPEKKLPGINSISPVTPLQGGRTEENTLARQMRMAGYNSHRGKAVIPRDYERIILEAFPGIDCVKCIPFFDNDKPAAGILTIAIIPAKQPGKEKAWKLLTSSLVRKQIRDYLINCSSPKVKAIRIVNPDYLKVKVKCEIDLHPQYPLSNCKARLNYLINYFIASWLIVEETPCFGYSLSLSKLYNQIRAQEYIHRIQHLSVILLGRGNKHFQLYEYKNINQVIHPPLPHTIFLPASEHTIGLKVLPSFGINEMDIDRNLIIK